MFRWKGELGTSDDVLLLLNALRSDRGDLHNFGRRTEREGDAFRKPRSVLYEQMLFGNGSALARGLEPHFPRELLEAIFHLDVTFDAAARGWALGAGTVGRVHACQPGDSDTRSYRFGALCAYAAAFEILDLNADNFVDVGAHLQVVDCESLFFELDVLGTSGLLPLMAGFPSPLEVLEASGGASAQALLAGYLDAERGLKAAQQILVDVLGAPETAAWPIRMFVRPSNAYALHLAERDLDALPSHHVVARSAGQAERVREHLRQSHEQQRDSSAFEPEELVQLERGDIPYFFTFLRRHASEPRRAFFATSADGDYAEVRSSRLLAAETTWTVEDLAGDGLEGRLTRGFLQLAHATLPSMREGSCTLASGVHLGWDGNTLRVAKGGRRYTAMPSPARRGRGRALLAFEVPP